MEIVATVTNVQPSCNQASFILSKVREQRRADGSTMIFAGSRPLKKALSAKGGVNSGSRDENLGS
jgi:hypothetical protein